MHIKRFYGCLAAVWVLLGVFSVAWADQGPLAVQNRFPLHLLFLTPRPTTAELPSKGAMRTQMAVDYSSVYVDQHNNQWDFLLDMEMVTVGLSLAYGLTASTAIRLDVPLVSMNSGFLDVFLEGYHDALGVSNYGRENRPSNSFAYQVSKDGLRWIEGDSGGLHLADVTVSAQWALPRPSFLPHWKSTLLVSVKLPTGDVHGGFGSGRSDMGVFAPSQWSNKAWSFYMMPGFLWHSDPETPGVDVNARNNFSFFAGAGYQYNHQWSWLAQLNYATSPIEHTGIGMLDDGAVELALGFRRFLNRQWCLEFAFCEDLFTRTAPDFTVHMGLVWSYGE